MSTTPDQTLSAQRPPRHPRRPKSQHVAPKSRPGSLSVFRGWWTVDARCSLGALPPSRTFTSTSKSTCKSTCYRWCFCLCFYFCFSFGFHTPHATRLQSNPVSPSLRPPFSAFDLGSASCLLCSLVYQPSFAHFARTHTQPTTTRPLPHLTCLTFPSYLALQQEFAPLFSGPHSLPQYLLHFPPWQRLLLSAIVLRQGQDLMFNFIPKSPSTAPASNLHPPWLLYVYTII
ncbi:hypothetical protein BGZ61DRAFT_150794 [Ilyonectria robusta]|uniref:uncharacterized protein n=1 Tax=Ilyonectria robusta TaxID=1079257 RepID=UPI001E8D6AEC|nr:uncharacterized protein BGZ61DRAFT_150794 [Ilyonectria robusta]KAH8661345.1 hypothetical protein BGZ61DRAFT_150794 [Ilyonectria robusta]